MIAAGAVNHGVTKFWLAVPFMVYLVYASYRHNKLLVLVSLLYILFAISISINRDKIPLLYPIIEGGEVIITKTGYLKTFTDSNGQWYEPYEFIDEDTMLMWEKHKIALEDFVNNPLATSTVITYTHQFGEGANKYIRVKKGDTFKVLKVDHTFPLMFPWFLETFTLHTDDGSSYNVYASSYAYSMQEGKYGLNGNGEYFTDCTFNKEIMSGWSMWLSDTMPLYLVPVLLITLMIRKFRTKSLNQIT